MVAHTFFIFLRVLHFFIMSNAQDFREPITIQILVVCYQERGRRLPGESKRIVRGWTEDRNQQHYEEASHLIHR